LANVFDQEQVELATDKAATLPFFPRQALDQQFERAEIASAENGIQYDDELEEGEQCEVPRDGPGEAHNVDFRRIIPEACDQQEGTNTTHYERHRNRAPSENLADKAVDRAHHLSLIAGGGGQQHNEGEEHQADADK